MAATVVGTILEQIAAGLDPMESLAQLPLGLISIDNAEALIGTFLQTALTAKTAGVASEEAARSIISMFDIQRSHIDPLPALTYLVLNPMLTREALQFAVNCFPDRDPIQYYVDLVNMPNDLEAIRAIATLSLVLPELSNNDWALLYQLTDNTEDEEYTNQMLRTFFQTKVAETGQSIPKPLWVRDYPTPDLNSLTTPDPHTPVSLNLSTTSNGRLLNLPTVKEAVDLILSDMKAKMAAFTADGESIDIEHGLEIRETLISQYAISTLTEKIQMLAPILSTPALTDTSLPSMLAPIKSFPENLPPLEFLFREYGPINTIYGHDGDELDGSDVNDGGSECVRYGGCTMFLCSEFEEMNDNGDDMDLMTIEEHLQELDWFRGSCDVCLKQIPYRHYAVRLPLNHGGWQGCYCSFECLKPRIPNKQVAIMVGRMQEQLDVIGIRDR